MDLGYVARRRLKTTEQLFVGQKLQICKQRVFYG